VQSAKPKVIRFYLKYQFYFSAFFSFFLSPSFLIKVSVRIVLVFLKRKIEDKQTKPKRRRGGKWKRNTKEINGERRGRKRNSERLGKEEEGGRKGAKKQRGAEQDRDDTKTAPKGKL
jgi:hypothetical protein